MSELNIITYSEIEVQQVQWLWEGFIPLGKITIVHGDSGEGKTTAMLQIIGAFTTGRGILSAPEDERLTEPVNVIYQTAEDGLADTIKPRLLNAHADCSRVHIICEDECLLTVEDPRLEAAIQETQASLVVLDPMQAYLGAQVNMNAANEVRPILHALSMIAEKHQCAIVLVGHLNKNQKTQAAYRGLGSVDFGAAARSILLCARSPDDPDLKVLAPQKSSLCYKATAVAFRLSKEDGFQWEGECDYSADELLTGKAENRKLDKAKDFLEKRLLNGSQPSAALEAEANSLGISKRTLMTARKELGIISQKAGNAWYLLLPNNK